MKYFSAFSGIGGFELGIHQAYELHKLCLKNTKQRQTARNTKRRLSKFTNLNTNRFTCVGYSEIDRYAIQVYHKHFPTHHNYGDITKITAKNLPNFELLVGGFPCQAFSITEKRKGFKDIRGAMFFELARILRAKQPRLFLFENVKGLLSHDHGHTFKTIITTLTKLGYDQQWQVLNSKNFGVPQNRERVFIIGHLRTTCGRQVFPFGKNSEASKVRIEIIGTTKEVHSTRIGVRDQVYSPNGLAGALRTSDYKQPPQILEFTHKQRQGYRVYNPHGISTTIASQGGGLGAKTGLYKTSGQRIRRLTPTECERLQGFPDDWTEGLSDTQRYKSLGNAVTVQVIQAIMERILL